MNPIRSTKYCGNDCGDLHVCEADALVCCGAEAILVHTWICTECGYETDDEESARYCCLDEEVVLPLTPAELEAAGQLRLAL